MCTSGGTVGRCHDGLDLGPSWKCGNIKGVICIFLPFSEIVDGLS